MMIEPVDRERHIALADFCTRTAARCQLESLSMSARYGCNSDRAKMQRYAARLRINATDHLMLAGETWHFNADDHRLAGPLS